MEKVSLFICCLFSRAEPDSKSAHDVIVVGRVCFFFFCYRVSLSLLDGSDFLNKTETRRVSAVRFE